MIAIRVAVERGFEVGLAAEVSDPVGGDYWTVYVPDKIPGSDPGGVLVRVHKQSGETEIDMSL